MATAVDLRETLLAMHGKVVLVCTDRTRTWRQVTPPLASAGNRLVHASSTESALSLLWTGAVDLALIEWPSGVAIDPLIEAAGDRVPIVVLVGETGIRALEELVCRRGLFHLCAARAEQEASTARVLDPAELVVTCEKILRRDIFGLDKYLAGFGIERPSRTATRAHERDGVVRQLASAVRMLGAGRRVVESVSLVGDELFTNAVYNAPRDGDGRPRYAHIDRRDKIALDPDEYVRIEFGSDGRTFGLSVSDGFGALRPAELRTAIERCVARPDPIERKPGGAGIGLFATLCHVDHLVINLDPGARTEVIALWGLTRRTGGRGAGVASLHIFEQPGGAAGAAAEAVPLMVPTVALSDSAKNEIWSTLGSGARAALPDDEPREGAPAVRATGAATEVVRVAELDPEPDDEIPVPGQHTAREVVLEVDTVMIEEIELDRPETGTVKEVILEVETGMMLQIEPDPGIEADEPSASDTTPLPVIDDALADDHTIGGAEEPRPATETSDGGDEEDSALPADPSAVDMADLFEVATVMEATSLLGSPTPAWLGPLTCLRGVQVVRQSDGPRFDDALAGVRAAPTLAEAVEVVLAHLALDWTAAMLLCRIGDALVPWSAAGEVDSWDELCELDIPLASGWLSARSLSPGVTLAALDDDASARRLADSLIGRTADQGLALSFVLDRAVLVLFACRNRPDADAGDTAPFEELQRELSELTARIDRFSRLPTARKPAARAGSV